MKNKVILLLMLLSVASINSYALGLGDLLGGDEKSGTSKADPTTVENDLKSIVVTSSRAIEKLSEALGLKDQAEKMKKNADCIEKNECGVKDAIDTLNGGSSALTKEIANKKQGGEKLSGDASSKALQAIGPGVKALPLWKRVLDGATALSKDMPAMMKAPALAKAIPAVPSAAKGTVDLFKITIDYLTFSGVDTSTIKADLDAGMKGL